MERSPPSTFLDNPYFFCENGKEFSWREVAEEIGKAMHTAGKLKDPQPKTYPESTYEDLFVSHLNLLFSVAPMLLSLLPILPPSLQEQPESHRKIPTKPFL